MLFNLVLHRDGLRSATTGFDNQRVLHAHHIKHRAKGGPTVMSNLVPQCTTCHALQHADLLEVIGNATTGELSWKRKPRPRDVKARDVTMLIDKAARLAEAARPGNRHDDGAAGRAESGNRRDAGAAGRAESGNRRDAGAAGRAESRRRTRPTADPTESRRRTEVANVADPPVQTPDKAPSAASDAALRKPAG